MYQGGFEVVFQIIACIFVLITVITLITLLVKSDFIEWYLFDFFGFKIDSHGFPVIWWIIFLIIMGYMGGFF